MYKKTGHLLTMNILRKNSLFGKNRIVIYLNTYKTNFNKNKFFKYY